MYGWWQSFEHFSAPGSSPVAVSTDLSRVEQHARGHWVGAGKKPVIGETHDDDWRIAYRIDPQELHRQSESQRRRYDRARRGGSRGELGEQPPHSELFVDSVDLDAKAPPPSAPPLQVAIDQQSLLNELDSLRRATSPDGKRQAPYKYIVLRWAVERARAGQPRLARFNNVRSELQNLLEPAKIGASSPKPHDPWFALRHSQWWELHDVPTGATETVVLRRNLAGGLSTPVYNLIVGNDAFAEAALGALDRLIKRDSPSAPIAETSQPTAPAAVSPVSVLVAVETATVESFQVAEACNSVAERKRREAMLQNCYRRHLEKQQHEVMRNQITTIDGDVLLTDLYDVTTDTLIEAKASTDRMTLRLALGQILDYGRYLGSPRMLVLTPECPSSEMLELFHSSGIGSVWPAGDDFETSLPDCAQSATST